jgi:hypothetical protein
LQCDNIDWRNFDHNNTEVSGGTVKAKRFDAYNDKGSVLGTNEWDSDKCAEEERRWLPWPIINLISWSQSIKYSF